MRGEKPYADMLLRVVQLVVLFSLIQAVNTQVWYTGVVDIDYTEGLPEGAGLEVELEVDNQSADGSIHVDGFITYMNWQNSRNDTTIASESEDYDGEEMDFKPLSEVQEEVPIMAKIAFSLAVLLFGLTFFRIKYRAIVGLILSGLVFWIAFSLLILAPLGYVGGMDFGTGSMNNDDGESAVHQTMDGSSSIDLINGELDYEFTIQSYDLGLVNENDLDEVIANPPGENHRSYMEMEGLAGIHYGEFVVDLVWARAILFVLAPFSIATFNRVKVDKPQKL